MEIILDNARNYFDGGKIAIHRRIESMETKINISFIKEEKNIEIDIQQPDLSNLVHKIIAEHLLVSELNIQILRITIILIKKSFYKC